MWYISYQKVRHMQTIIQVYFKGVPTYHWDYLVENDTVAKEVLTELGFVETNEGEFLHNDKGKVAFLRKPQTIDDLREFIK